MEPERPTARSNPARGVALIATAVVLGLFIVRSGFDDTSSASGDAATTETPAGEEGAAPLPGGEGEGGSTTAPPPPARQPSEVTVLVANASGVSGAAGQLTDTIAAAGYNTVPGTNAPPETQPDVSQVLHAAGYEQEAAALATAIGAPNGVAAMPEPAPVELNGAQILVFLGTDLANG